ncbi:MAG: hypothetical protein PHS54_06100 [Clostridia bacterium]|nr:hypothetical protein [Clostridia bacterium]
MGKENIEIGCSDVGLIINNSGDCHLVVDKYSSGLFEVYDIKDKNIKKWDRDRNNCSLYVDENGTPWIFYRNVNKILQLVSPKYGRELGILYPGYLFERRVGLVPLSKLEELQIEIDGALKIKKERKQKRLITKKEKNELNQDKWEKYKNQRYKDLGM